MGHCCWGQVVIGPQTTAVIDPNSHSLTFKQAVQASSIVSWEAFFCAASSGGKTPGP